MRDKAQAWFKHLALAAFTLFLCSFTLILGAVPLHAWRQAYGKVNFVFGVGLLLAGLLSFGIYPLAIILGALATLVFFFNEFEDRGVGMIGAGFYALLGTSLASFVGVQFWQQVSGKTLAVVMEGSIKSFIDQLQAMNNSSSTAATMQISVAEVVAQIPSIVVALLASSIVLAIVFEPRLRQIFGLPTKDRKEAFLKMRLPDGLIWISIASLLAAFVNFDVPLAQTIGTNLVNALGFAYFLQGMAIVTRFFDVYKVGPLVRSLSYIFLVLQLFVFVSCIGFIDYWLDFRSRLDKKSDGAEEANGKGGI